MDRSHVQIFNYFICYTCLNYRRTDKIYNTYYSDSATRPAFGRPVPRFYALCPSKHSLKVGRSGAASVNSCRRERILCHEQDQVRLEGDPPHRHSTQADAHHHRGGGGCGVQGRRGCLVVAMSWEGWQATRLWTLMV